LAPIRLVAEARSLLLAGLGLFQSPAKSGADLQLLRLKGGLEPDGDESFAEVAGSIVRREAGESVESFKDRARAAAEACGAPFVAFGGLPRMPTGEEGA
jgi:hypothetical protein